jgi:hypothetical protein
MANKWIEAFLGYQLCQDANPFHIDSWLPWDMVKVN